MRVPRLVDVARWPDGRVLRRVIDDATAGEGSLCFAFDPPMVNRTHHLGSIMTSVAHGRMLDPDVHYILTADGRRRFLWFCLATAPRDFLLGDLYSGSVSLLLAPREIPEWLVSIAGPGTWVDQNSGYLTDLRSSGEVATEGTYWEQLRGLLAAWNGDNHPSRLRVNAYGADTHVLDLQFDIGGNEYFLMYGHLGPDTSWDTTDPVRARIGAAPASFFVVDSSDTVIGAGASPWEALALVPFFHGPTPLERQQWEERTAVPGELLVDIDLWRLLDELPPVWKSDAEFLESIP